MVSQYGSQTGMSPLCDGFITIRADVVSSPQSRLVPLLCQGGYDYRFVAPGPTDDQKCPICHLVVRDAHQVTCCGKLFCYGCINKCKRRNNLCPHCQQNVGMNYFKDVRGDREIKSLKVVCNRLISGCKWNGELRDIEKHMEDDCSYKMVDCPLGCGKQEMRGQIESHSLNRCPLRQYVCPLCKKKGTYCFITGKHQGKCPKVEVPCPNEGCTVRMERQDSAQHGKVCPKQLVKCPFASFGCSFHDCLELLPQHTEKEVQSHMEKIAQRMEKQCEDQSKEMEKQAKKIENIAIQSKGLVENRFAPITVKFTEYDGYKQENKAWYSNSFYTGPGGYKVRLSVCPNGDSDGDGEFTHVSVYINLMPGENDDNLEFPMRGSFDITLLNQRQDAIHYTLTLTLTGNESEGFNRQYKTDTSGYGWPNFIEHSRLCGDPQYLMNDCLYFKIEASLLSNTKPWLAA